jgi:hypothetical protein
MTNIVNGFGSGFNQVIPNHLEFNSSAKDENSFRGSRATNFKDN